MEKETTRKTSDEGIFYQEETIRTTPEDGIVSDRDIRPAAMPAETRGKARVGYSTTKSFSTNDPKVTRTFVYIFCAVFLIIGIVAFALGQKVFGILFAAAAVFIFVKENKRIDEIAKDLEAKGADTTIDSPEELKEVVSGVSHEMKEKFTESAQETFTDDNFKRFTRLTLPIYAVITVAVSLALGFVVRMSMGIFIFFLLTFFGILYYCVFLKLLAKLFRKK